MTLIAKRQFAILSGGTAWRLSGRGMAKKQPSADIEKAQQKARKMFGLRLKQLRGWCELTQGQLSELLTKQFGPGFTQNAISTWEKGTHRPIGSKINDLCEFFGVSNNSILGTKEAKFEFPTHIPSLPPSQKKRRKRRSRPRLNTDSDGPPRPSHAASN